MSAVSESAGRRVAWTEEAATKERTTREGDASKRPAGERTSKQSDRHTRLSREHRLRRLERRYRRLIALYPAAHRAEHADEMVGVLLAGGTEDRLAQLADLADLVGGAARIRTRSAVRRLRQRGVLRGLVQDQRWSDALAVASVIAPLLLLVAMLA